MAEASPSLERAADALRTDLIDLPGALRWLRRRIRLVQRCLVLMIGLFPDHLGECTPQVNAVRQRLGCDAVLMALRSLASQQLSLLPSPLGFYPHWIDGGDLTSPDQQRTGRDPPARRR